MTRADYQFSFASAFDKLTWGIEEPNPHLDGSHDLSLSAVRNEVCGFQIFIHADHEYVLCLDRSNWLHPLGFKPRLRLEVKFAGLPPSVMECFSVGYIEGDDRRWWTETLERSGWAEAPAGRIQPVYTRLRIPKEIEPGTYPGIAIAYAQEGFGPEQIVWEGKIQLQISSISLPDPADFHFHLNLWQHCTSIARYHHVALWSKPHFDLIDRYFESLAQLGQKSVTIIAAEIPWSGQRCFRDPAYPSYLFEHSAVDVYRSQEGQLRCDFSNLDCLVNLALKHGMAQEIDLFGLINVWQDEAYGFGKVALDAPDAVRVRCYDEAAGTFFYLQTAEDLRRYIRLLHDHLKEQGWLNRVRVAADEPSDLQAFNASLAFLQEAGPEFRYNAAINHFEFIEDAPAGVSDFIPVLPLVCREPERTARLITYVHQLGGKMLWYICCGPPIPNTFLHSPLVESRLVGWLTHYLNLDGFLRWAFCLWPADPWKRVSFRAPGWSAGDMFFILPGNDGAPVETLRYEALRAAVQDYELLNLVQQRLPEKPAQEVFQQAYSLIFKTNSLSDFAGVDSARASDLYSLDPADYARARQIIVNALEGS